MTKADRFMVAAFTEQWPELTSMNAWPQHLTIMPWLLGDRDQAGRKITSICQEFCPLELTVDGQARFGPNHDVPVWTIAANMVLKGLHQAIIGGVGRHAELENGDFTGDHYRPHITQKPGQPSLEVGDRLVLPMLSIIGKYDETHKVIYQNIELQGGEAAA